MWEIDKLNRQQIGHSRPWGIDDRQLGVNAYRIEAVLPTRLAEPFPEGGREFVAVQIVEAQPLFPCLAVVGLLPQMGMQMVDPETQKRISLGRYEPPSLVLLDAKEARRLEPFARPAAEAIKTDGISTRFALFHFFASSIVFLQHFRHTSPALKQAGLVIQINHETPRALASSLQKQVRGEPEVNGVEHQ